MSAALAIAPDSPSRVVLPAAASRPRAALLPPLGTPERAVANAAAHLAADEHCLAVAREWVADAERTHSRPVTMRRRGVDVVVIPGKPFTPERMAERRAYALARVAECQGRVDASRERLFAARWALGRVGVDAAP